MKQEIIITGVKNGLLFTKDNGSISIATRDKFGAEVFLEISTIGDLIQNPEGIRNGREVKITISIEELN